MTAPNVVDLCVHLVRRGPGVVLSDLADVSGLGIIRSAVSRRGAASDAPIDTVAGVVEVDHARLPQASSVDLTLGGRSIAGPRLIVRNHDCPLAGSCPALSCRLRSGRKRGSQREGQVTATVHVAVLDPLPMFRRGVAASLSNLGHLVEEPSNAEAWVRERPGGLVLLTLHSAEDLDRLTALCRLRPRPLVVALPPADDASLGVRAIRAGARSVVARETTESALQRTVSATLAGEAAMPADVADLLVSGLDGRAPRSSAPSAEQIAWLRRLSDGWTVTRLALEVGYSERAMYRLLRALYQRIGVSTRLEAVVLAHDKGWFEN